MARPFAQATGPNDYVVSRHYWTQMRQRQSVRIEQPALVSTALPTCGLPSSAVSFASSSTCVCATWRSESGISSRVSRAITISSCWNIVNLSEEACFRVPLGHNGTQNLTKHIGHLCRRRGLITEWTLNEKLFLLYFRSRQDRPFGKRKNP